MDCENYFFNVIYLSVLAICSISIALLPIVGK